MSKRRSYIVTLTWAPSSPTETLYRKVYLPSFENRSQISQVIDAVYDFFKL